MGIQGNCARELKQATEVRHICRTRDAEYEVSQERHKADIAPTEFGVGYNLELQRCRADAHDGTAARFMGPAGVLPIINRTKYQTQSVAGNDHTPQFLELDLLEILQALRDLFQHSGCFVFDEIMFHASLL